MNIFITTNKNVLYSTVLCIRFIIQLYKKSVVKPRHTNKSRYTHSILNSKIAPY